MPNRVHLQVGEFESSSFPVLRLRTFDDSRIRNMSSVFPESATLRLCSLILCKVCVGAQGSIQRVQICESYPSILRSLSNGLIVTACNFALVFAPYLDEIVSLPKTSFPGEYLSENSVYEFLSLSRSKLFRVTSRTRGCRWLLSGFCAC